MRTYDFDLLHDDGTVEALEVTEATDKSLRDAQGARAAKVPGAVLPAPAFVGAGICTRRDGPASPL
jgi:hypothetical protein